MINKIKKDRINELSKLKIKERTNQQTNPKKEKSFAKSIYPQSKLFHLLR
jgi:hypothetical protein